MQRNCCRCYQRPRPGDHPAARARPRAGAGRAPRGPAACRPAHHGSTEPAPAPAAVHPRPRSSGGGTAGRAQRDRHPLRGRQCDRDLGRAGHPRTLGELIRQRTVAASSAGRSDHRRDFGHGGAAIGRGSCSSPGSTAEQPVRDHQLFQHHPHIARSRGDRRPRAVRTTTTVTTGTGSTTRPRRQRDRHHRAVAGQLAGITARSRLRGAQFERDLRLDHQRGALRQPLEHPLAASIMTLDTQRPISWSARKSRSPRARALSPNSTTPSAPCSGRMSASRLEVTPQINAGLDQARPRVEVSAIAGPVGTNARI